MPNIKSAQKRLEQDKRKRDRNRARKSRLWTEEKKFIKCIEDKDFDAAKKQLAIVCSVYDKAAKLDVIPSNRADRKKARLTRTLRTAEGV